MRVAIWRASRGKRRRDFCRHARDFQNVVAVLVLGHLETFDLAVAAARGDDRDLALEIDEAFEDAGRVLQRAPGGDRIAAFRDLGLALAVIAKPAGLQHGRQAGQRDAVGQLRRAVDRRVRRGRDLQRADEILFDQPVLRRLQHLRVGQDRLAPGEKGRGLRRHVLEFIGDDVDGAGKAAERGLVVICGAGAGVHHVKGAGILFRRIDVAAQSRAAPLQARACGQLPAAENADGRAGFRADRVLSALSSACATALVCRLRQASSRLASLPSESASTAAASSAALIAPALPMASVPTGMPPGICMIESSESLPSSACVLIGTPNTGSGVSDAAMPGRCAAPPAPAMITLKPFSRRAAGKLVEPLGGAVRGDDARVVADFQGVERLGGVLHRGPVGLAAHDDRDRF